MPATNDPYAPLREKVLQRALEGTGETGPSLRRAVADRAGVPADLRGLVEKIHDHAYKVTDEDIARLQTYSDDQLFEIIVSASLGASRRRLMAGLKALGDA